MSLRNNRAAKLNRYMMFGMFFLGIIVLGCVFAFLYLAYSKTDNPFVGQSQEQGVVTDSIVLIVNDSIALR